ncbi:MAG TPA: DNA polymerase III subunit alpha, partial [Candidatus Babeliaceae bacterium]|nr:DNA polymerase III subunit alpha [Candidatus Babeliaceae bacterium]
DAVWAAGRIADRCNFTFETGKLFFPLYEIPNKISQEEYFAQLCRTGLKKLFDAERIDRAQESLYYERLELEIQLITTMGFVGYFLVVGDFIQWARAQNIPVGPGRGSAAGSLVAWALQITDIDPIKYNLLFERFLNPERVSMPDIDIDFCIEGRDRVINYVRDRYGHDKVCQIITFGTMLAKGVIKDVARVLGFPFEDSNALTDLIPDQLKITLKEALEQEPKLKELITSNAQVAKLFDIAQRLEGLTRHASKHAAGIVISPHPISEMIPVYVPPKTTELVTQYAMTELESLGFLKMDFLGLKNLTLIQRAIELIAQTQNITLDITKIPLEDPKTFFLLAQGNTSGVFQLESDGIKDVLRRLQPSTFEDVIAVNALYRPGPLGSGMVDDFIERRHARQAIQYLFPELEEVLKETYGVIVYQEQVMKIASIIGGYSLGEADILRRAMGKKKADVMAAQKALFVERANQRSFDIKKAEELFDLMAYFAGYGFNKSHSAAYALIAYQTAYLKAHYPAEFMACLISLEAGDAEKMAFYIKEAKDMGLAILPPSINHSQTRFAVVNGAIRFGLHGIKNVGTAALDNILQERSSKGNFLHMLNFCTRVDLRTCNKRVIESLICAGAFDELPGSRVQKYEELTKIIERATEKKKQTATGQMGLFDVTMSANSQTITEEEYYFSDKPEWTTLMQLEKEKEVVGLYISAQPLDVYKKYLEWLNVQPLQTLAPGAQPITCAGIAASTKIITTKKGDKMAFMLLEDTLGKAEIILFPKVLKKVQHLIDSYNAFTIKGIVDQSTGPLPKVKAIDCIPLELIAQEGTGITEILINLPITYHEHELQELKSTITPGHITLTFNIIENSKKIKVSARQKIALTPSLLDCLDKYQWSRRFVL